MHTGRRLAVVFVAFITPYGGFADTQQDHPVRVNNASKKLLAEIQHKSVEAMNRVKAEARKRHLLVGTQWPLYMNSGLPSKNHWYCAYSADMKTGSIIPFQQLSYTNVPDYQNEGVVRNWSFLATTSAIGPRTPPASPFIAATMDTNFRFASGVVPSKPIVVPVSCNYMCAGTSPTSLNAVLCFQAESGDNHPVGQPVHIFINLVNVDSEATKVAVLWNGQPCTPTTGGLASDGTVTLAAGPPNALGGSVIFDSDETFTDSCTLQIFVSNQGGTDLNNHSVAVSGWVSE